jgi:hypothetical protein
MQCSVVISEAGIAFIFRNSRPVIINYGYLNLTDESDTFLRNVGSNLPKDATSHVCEKLSVTIRNLD